MRTVLRISGPERGLSLDFVTVNWHVRAQNAMEVGAKSLFGCAVQGAGTRSGTAGSDCFESYAMQVSVRFDDDSVIARPSRIARIRSPAARIASRARSSCGVLQQPQGSQRPPDFTSANLSHNEHQRGLF